MPAYGQASTIWRQEQNGSLVQASVRAAVRDSYLPAKVQEGINLPNNDDSEAQWRRSRRLSLRVRLRPLTTSTKLSRGNSRPWRSLQPFIVRPAVDWTSGLGRSL